MSHATHSHQYQHTITQSCKLTLFLGEACLQLLHLLPVLVSLLLHLLVSLLLHLLLSTKCLYLLVSLLLLLKKCLYLLHL